MEYWYNTRTGRVESGSDPKRARSADLLGPYASEEEASRALQIAAERTARWEEQERAEDEWASGDPDRRSWDTNPLND